MWYKKNWQKRMRHTAWWHNKNLFYWIHSSDLFLYAWPHTPKIPHIIQRLLLNSIMFHLIKPKTKQCSENPRPTNPLNILKIPLQMGWLQKFKKLEYKLFTYRFFVISRYWIRLNNFCWKCSRDETLTIIC